MTNPYRAMCAELAEELVNEYGYCTEWEKGLPLCESNVSELLTRARALLAQPVAEGPTDEELDVIERQCWIPTEVCNDAGCEYLLDHRRFAHAVLSRWGRPTPQPVAASERLPEPEDCDAEGRCWGWWTDPMSEYWEYVGVSAPIEPYGSYIPRAGHTHWLPANALPPPEDTNDY